MSADDLDWRLYQGQETYLTGITLHWSRWTQTRPHWDHDHCAFCWAKFMDADWPGILREGYTDALDYHWICASCFSDFRDRFRWNLDEAAPTDTSQEST